jgi:2,3-bisphosphoglycerate-dependent phosphoglycerate mutase
LGVEMVVDGALIEHDPGECDGMSFDEYVKRFPIRRPWGADPDAVIFPGGETHAMFRARVGATIDRLCVAHAGATIVVVCHGGVIDGAIRHLMTVPSFGAFDLEIVNTSITELVFRDPQWALLRFNDAAHLHDVEPIPPEARAVEQS